MHRNQTIGGFIKKFITQNLLYSEQFIQYPTPLVSTDFTYKKIEDFLSQQFTSFYSPYQFIYHNLSQIETQPQAKQNKGVQKIMMHHPIGLINFKQKQQENDFQPVQSESFVHSMDLVTSAWKMDEFDLDEVQTVESEYELNSCIDEDEFNSSDLKFSYQSSKGSILSASACF
ncbi:hypothetical protein PPERSA_05734 [Pseudocohnilembus persalinus]|uniref:Uncharacterized protein n=1 Tax=Pseudocohnilembus persalinus TaxID=266149 RepID=A0A0V0QIA1_PSEPJ|nr:hypothetical protein PPERSA_05734 [Pseudocohnilembus persalinus]|eukprot:KRX01895.1 hypothetical protein PPERSA_05734 [Pseudocohnilembus persalinus]